jgi:hypothetical protein
MNWQQHGIAVWSDVMKMHPLLLSLGAGILAGVIHSQLNVRSPAPQRRRSPLHFAPMPKRIPCPKMT